VDLSVGFSSEFDVARAAPSDCKGVSAARVWLPGLCEVEMLRMRQAKMDTCAVVRKCVIVLAVKKEPEQSVGALPAVTTAATGSFDQNQPGSLQLLQLRRYGPESNNSWTLTWALARSVAKGLLGDPLSPEQIWAGMQWDASSSILGDCDLTVGLSRVSCCRPGCSFELAMERVQ
jgi:hypothetical protein